jgi:predicted nucleic acid-binding Zn ribbon protein
VVGEQVAKVTIPQRVDNGVLMVSVSTAPWRAELTMRRREILDKIRRTCPDAGVTDIRFR